MNQTLTKQLSIALVAALLFIPFLGQVHLFDWDEVNFGESAREMLISKNYLRVQIDFQPFWEKPPLFIWMQALCMSIFGINEFAARLPNALMGIATLCTLFYVGKRVVNERMAWWWVVVYACTWLPHFYFKSAIIDPTFNFFIFLSFFQVYLIRNGQRKILHAVLGGLFLGLAVLTKGPAAILIALLSLGAYLIVNKGIWGYKIGHFVLFTLVCFATVALWFGMDIIQNGWWFTKEFIVYQIRLFSTEDAGHGGPFFYHWVVLLIGCFPAAAFLFQSGRTSTAVSTRREESDFARWMWILFWVTLLLFSIVKTKIVHYSSLCYFPLSFLAALQITRLDEKKIELKKLVIIILAVTGILLGLAITLLPAVGINKEMLIPYFDDDFAVANLQANVEWSYFACLIGIAYLAAIIFALVNMRRALNKALIVLLLSQLLVIECAMVYIVPRIEGYSQNAAVEYYKSFAGKDVYLQPLDFKSYAYLFYSEKQPSTHPEYHANKLEWLLNGPIDKPAYFISKNIVQEKWASHPNLEVIGSKNGYVFYKRK